VRGVLLYPQSIDWAAGVGMALIVAGLAVIQPFSKTAAH
jgi:multidrug transporter EmrE-like cation transporter